MTGAALTDFDLELSWLVFKATRDTWMDDAEHSRWKRIAWAEAKEMEQAQPGRFAGMREALSNAMRPTH